MKFYIYTNKTSDEDLNNFIAIVKKIYPQSEVEVGKGKPSKAKQERLDLELAYVIKAEELLNKSKYNTAVAVIEVTGVGVSESVLKRL